MATTKKTTTKKTTKKEETEVKTPEEIVTTPEEVVKTPVTPNLPDYSQLSPFGRLMAGGGIK